MGDFNVNASAPNTVAGFGLHIEDTSMGNLNLQNFGQVTIRSGFMHKIIMKNTGIPSNGDLEVDDVLSEALNNEDFLTVDTSGGPVTDIILRRVALADSIGKVYMPRHTHQSNINRNTNIKFDAEVLVNGRWIIVDPGFRVILRTPDGNTLTREQLMSPTV